MTPTHASRTQARPWARSPTQCAVAFCLLAFQACGQQGTEKPAADLASSDTITYDAAPTPDQAPQDRDITPSDESVNADVAEPPAQVHLFEATTLAQISLDFDEAAMSTLLETGADAVVTADLEVDGALLSQIQVERYGPDGTLGEMTGKPGFFLRLDPGNLGQGLAGYTSLILDNMAEDAGMVREHILNRLLREHGLPAPRTKYAWLTINGESIGLYLLMEPMSDPLFAMQWFEGPGVLYWGVKGSDVTPSESGGLLLRAGDDPRREKLNQLVSHLDAVTGDDLFEQLEEVLDMPAFLAYVAVEVMTGVRRGYVWGRRNYALFQDPGDSRWRILPHELGRTLRKGFDPLGARGKIQVLCMSDPACRLKLGDAYELLAQHIDELQWVQTLLLGKSFLLEAASVDTRIPYTLDEVSQSIDASASFLATHPQAVLMNLACLEPEKVDEDGDGYSGCGEDCDDKDPTVHPGADELCNLTDDNCNDILDDSPDCPPCHPFVSSAGVTFDLCFQVKDYLAAEEDCVARGTHLASIGSASEHQELVAAAFGLWQVSWWIGFDDLDEEGTFTWTDGSTGEYTAWADGEPNDSNAEDCGHLAGWAGGLWNDIQCKNALPYICRHPVQEVVVPDSEASEGDAGSQDGGGSDGSDV